MRTRAQVLVTLVLVGAAMSGGVPAATASGGKPVITTGGGTETFDDDFFLDLCGVVTQTTVTEKWTLTEFPDGSQTLHVRRTFDPADPRLPIEKGAGTSFTAADGSRWVVGKPIQLIGPDGGVRLRDAGRVLFDADGDVVRANGPHPSLDADLADYYCP